MSAVHGAVARLLRFLALAAVLGAIFAAYQRATVRNPEQLTSQVFDVRFHDGLVEQFLLAPSTEHLLKIRLPLSADFPREAVLNGRALSAHWLGESRHKSMKLAYFSVPAAALRPEGNELRIRGADGYSGDAVVTLMNFVGKSGDSFFCVFPDFSNDGVPMSAPGILIRVCLALLTVALISLTAFVVPGGGRNLLLAYFWAFLLVVDSLRPIAGMRVCLDEHMFWPFVFGSIAAVSAISYRSVIPLVLEQVDRLPRLDPLIDRATARWAILQRFDTPRILLMFIAAVLAAHYIVNLILPHRMPLGHDTLQYMQFQYGALNERVSKGELPLWEPFMTKGTVSNWWVLIQSHLVADVYYLVTPAVRRINDYYLFYFATYCDEFLFAIGMFLLALELYKTRWAVFFAATAAVFSTVWLIEIWWNFRLYCWLPFGFYFFLRFIKTGSWRFFFLFCLILPLTFFAGLPYFFSIISLVLFWFGLLSTIASWPELEAGLIASWRKKGTAGALLKGLAAIAVSGALLGLLYFYLRNLGAEAIALSNIGRDASGAVTLDVFLTYGGNIDWSKFIGLVTGFSSSLDQTNYCGLAVVVFALMQVRYWWKREPIPRQSLVFLTMILLMISFSTGGVVARLSYRYWPTMKLFRHIGLTSGVTKLLLILFSGYGVDAFAEKAASPGRSFFGDLRAVLVLIAVVLLLKPLVHWQYHGGKDSIGLLRRLYQGIQLWSFSTAIFLWLPAVAVGAVLCRQNPWRGSAGLAVLIAMSLLHFVDVISYRVVEDSILAPAVGDGKFVDTFRFFDYSYSPTRSQRYFENDRFTALDAAARRATSEPDPFVVSKNGDVAFAEHAGWPFGSSYWTWESFFYFDACHTIFRADNRLASVADFYSVYRPASEDSFDNVESPMPQSPAFLKMLGCGHPKLQVFKRIRVLPGETPLRALLASPGYTGDVLFSGGGPLSRAATEYSGDAKVLGADDRVDAKIRVETFGANGLRLAVDNPLKSPAILFYSDAWHKNWTASVDGASAPVYAANIGFKAVEIPAGVSQVEFSYRPPLVKAVLWTFIGFNVAMVFVLFGLVFSPLFSTRRFGAASVDPPSFSS